MTAVQVEPVAWCAARSGGGWTQKIVALAALVCATAFFFSTLLWPLLSPFVPAGFDPLKVVRHAVTPVGFDLVKIVRKSVGHTPVEDLVDRLREHGVELEGW